ncbi:MAG: AIR synthase family protein [Haloferacaceae archaeon]
MSDRLGKVNPDFLASHVFPRLGAERDDVAIGPADGVDFGVITVGDTALALATDPLSMVPALGFERAGRFAFEFVLADVAVSGLAPAHLAVCLTLPPETTDAEFAAFWDALDREASDLGVRVVTGHTARYEGCSYPWVGAATAVAAGDPADLVRPDGARPGDDLLVTRGPAVEATGLLATLFPDAVDLPADVLETAAERLDETRCVRDALTAAAAGPVHAMHDATEGGLAGALNEMAASAGVRFDVEGDAVPVRPGVIAFCDAVGMDPWAATTGGTLVLAVDPAGTDAVLAALRDRGTPVARVGRVRTGEGVYLDGEALSRPERDPSWEVFERLAAESERG